MVSTPDPATPIGALGLDIGARRARMAPVLQALTERGLPIRRRTITDLRGGRLNGRGLAIRFAAIERLHANDASLKTAFALRLLRTAADLRAPSDLEVRPYVTRGFSGAVCAVAGCTRPDFNRVVSVLRADFALWASVTRDHRFDAAFRDAARRFMLLTSPPDMWVWHRPTDYVDSAWDKQTIHGFYFALSQMANHVLRATWFTYEIDLLLRFYELQERLKSPLTPLDREVLASTYGRRGSKAELVDMVHAHIGLKYDVQSLYTQRSLLLGGVPKGLVRKLVGRSDGSPLSPYILLIEDERELREEIGGALREAGYRVRSAPNGGRALLSVLQELPALVLMDMRPPYDDARTFAQKCAAHGLKIRILAMTYAREGHRAANAVGASGWIEHYFSMAQLVQAVKEVLL